MANKKITDLDALTTIATTDLIAVVDVSDTTQASSGTTKKITQENFIGSAYAKTASPTFTGTVTMAALTATGTITAASGTWDSGGIDIATGDTYAINGTDVLSATTLGSGVVNSSLTSVGTLTSGNVDAAVSAASTTTAGKVELATAAEINTGTDTGRVPSVDTLAASYAGTKSVVWQVVADTTDTTTGDGQAHFFIPSAVGGMDLVGVHAYVETAGTTNTTDIQIHNETQAADMLSTVITIDSGETSSRTAATPPVIDTANDDVAAGDKIRFDVDAVSTTAAKGLWVELEFRLP